MRFSAAEAKLANERIDKIQTEYRALFGDLVRGGPNVQPTLARSAGTENVDLTLSNFHGLTDINARAVLLRVIGTRSQRRFFSRPRSDTTERHVS